MFRYFSVPSRAVFVSVFALAAVASGGARADTLLGLRPAAGEANAVSRFLAGQQGDAAPVTTLGGTGSGLSGADSLYFDALGGELWVSDFVAQRVVVFGVADQGGSAPRRIISSPSMGQPRDLAIVGNRSEIALITSGCCISFYPIAASGQTAALRSISWGGGSQTQLNNPADLAYAPQRDRLWVADYRSVEGESRGRVLVFERTAASNAAPAAVIEGPLTGFGSWVSAVEIDEANAELYVLAADATGGEEDFAIAVFGLDDVGNVAPRRRIAGSQTGLTNAVDLSLDRERRELNVASGAFNAQPSLRVFAASGTGNLAALRVVSGAATGSAADRGWYGVAVVPPLDRLFRDGFEPN